MLLATTLVCGAAALLAPSPRPVRAGRIAMAVSIPASPKEIAVEASLSVQRALAECVVWLLNPGRVTS